MNPNEPVPFGTLIQVDQTTGALTVGTQLILDKTHALQACQGCGPQGSTATNGAEQPVWDPGTGKFYLSIPEISGDGSTNLHGAVLRISTAGEVEAQYPVDFCGPAGLAVGPQKDLLVGCNTVYDVQGNVWDATKDITANPREVILDAETGIIEATVFGVGAGDEVWFNRGDGHYYVTGSGSPLRPTLSTAAQGASVLGVIDAFSNSLDQLVPTFNVPAVTGVHPAGTAHSVAVDAKNNHIFMPLAANNVYPDCTTGCIAVYWHGDEDEPGEAALP
jgi:hypothetical protein